MMAFTTNTGKPEQRLNQMNTVKVAVAKIEGQLEIVGFTQMLDTPMVDFQNEATLEQGGNYYLIGKCEHTGNVSAYRYSLTPKTVMWTNASNTTMVSAYLDAGLTRIAMYEEDVTVQQVVNSLTEERALDIQLMTFGK